VSQLLDAAMAIIDPHVEPADFSAGADGATNVEVHQTVRDLTVACCRTRSLSTLVAPSAPAEKSAGSTCGSIIAHCRVQ